ncbi:Purple acid phosphatase 22 [Apostasia shenzhenica]|uniref:Purple acid phosphatase 22 n=1 Tax=Apostasia shenzhenica TaxID=1088818 RepID=A0A2I0ADR6_9ASPA|nr:Purple acid phosphatase 22 [Apostasia shenzhenica]
MIYQYTIPRSDLWKAAHKRNNCRYINAASEELGTMIASTGKRPGGRAGAPAQKGTREGGRAGTGGQWLQADLAKVDRSRIPWLFVLIHAPWYNMNEAHQGEGEDMRKAMEEVLYAARVDAIFAGHVHAY